MDNPAQSFTFTLEQTKGTARAGTFVTPHGQVKTPIFMPVGTLATVKSLDAGDIHSTQAQIILANTYHLYLRPGMETLKAAGGVHDFMKWDKPMLTDSGGFQVFSLGLQQDLKTDKVQGDKVRGSGYRGLGKKVQGVGDKVQVKKSKSTIKMTEDGVEFTSHLDGSKHFFTPEKAIEIQQQIGADIIMAFDECTPDAADSAYAAQALERTHRWAERCVAAWENKQRLSEYGKYQALFGIVQGGMHQELRKKSAQFMADLPVDGVAVGGETVGYNMQGTVELMTWIDQILPEHKPRYAMGLGRDPQDLVDAVLAGFDMFDCVGPTRLARNGALYSGELVVEEGRPRFASDFNKGRMSIGRTEYTRDQAVIQPGCDCFTCSEGYTRSYLHHLYKTQELTYYRLASIHNVRTMVRLSEQLREYVLK